MRDLAGWLLIVLLLIVAPISLGTGLMLFALGQQTIAFFVALPGAIMFGWIGIEAMRSVTITETAYQKYMAGTFTEEDREKLARKIGISNSDISTEPIKQH